MALLASIVFLVLLHTYIMLALALMPFSANWPIEPGITFGQTVTHIPTMVWIVGPASSVLIYMALAAFLWRGAWLFAILVMYMIAEKTAWVLSSHMPNDTGWLIGTVMLGPQCLSLILAYNVRNPHRP